MGLGTYNKKRDFAKTSEPKGAQAKKAGRRGAARFVVHEHHASILHFDFRLEIDGVLKSWSIPKGPSMDPADRRLAVEVEDHPIAYGKFEGEIPEGQYGGGRVFIWDEGTFSVGRGEDAAAAWDAGKLSFTMRGKKLRGEFALVEMKGRKQKGKPQWLLLKKDDDAAESGWRLELVEEDPRFDPTPSAASAKRSAKRKVTPPKATKSAKPVSRAAFLRRRTREGDMAVKIEGETVELTHLDKVYWPDEGYTKGDLLAYYLKVARLVMPNLVGRPAILKRHPEGLRGEPFFQHDVTSAPAYVETKVLTSETGRKLNYAVYTGLASLLHLVNIGTIAQNPWHSRVESLDRPDYVVFDFDPKGAPFDNVLASALVARDVLAEIGVRNYPKTSGSSGIHVYVPVEGATYAETATFSERVAGLVASRAPKIATVERSLAERKKAQVYVDWQQNARGKSAASVYSVRAVPGATVSAPVTWDEIERGIALADFTIETMPDRIKKVGDLWRDVLRKPQKLPKLGK